MSIRLVAVDVDGTLVTSDQRVLPRVQDAVRRAAAQGVELVLCTGRAIGECWYVLDALPEIRYAVTHTGAMAQDLKTGELLYHCPLSADDARLIYSHLRRYDGLINFFSGGIVYNSKAQVDNFERYYPANFRWLFERSHEFVDDLDALVAGWDKPVEKFYVPFSGPEVCRQAWADLSQLPYFVTGAGFVDLEVMNPATNKGLALAALCRALGVRGRASGSGQDIVQNRSRHDPAVLENDAELTAYRMNVKVCEVSAVIEDGSGFRLFESEQQTDE